MICDNCQKNLTRNAFCSNRCKVAFHRKKAGFVGNALEFAIQPVKEASEPLTQEDLDKVRDITNPAPVLDADESVNVPLDIPLPAGEKVWGNCQGCGKYVYGIEQIEVVVEFERKNMKLCPSCRGKAKRS